MLHVGEVVFRVVFSPDGNVVATGGMRSARLWSAKTGAPLGPSLVQQSWLRDLAFSPDGKTVMTRGRDTVSFWSEIGELRASIENQGFSAGCERPSRIRDSALRR